MQTMQKCKQPPFCPVRPDDIPSEKRKVRNSFEKEEIKQAERKGRCPRRHSPCRFGSICPSQENERNLNAKVWKSPYVRVCVSEMREDCRYTLLVARRDLFFPHISIVLSAVLGRITCSSHWKKETLIVVIVCGRNICRRRLTQLTDLEILHVIVLSLSVTTRIVGTCYSFSLHC